ncbi:hypothetical protein BDV29DRAFT_182975 [Aspergillus leporis]|uniref:Uncharacterized protein n=1 Tax=Aspergillus leporis TaxID=41062 RepID=A0A5N5WNG1_9EURO|nr:hypothetical protein BDV29DRAFT_182975 [Aspergillus leporis]
METLRNELVLVLNRIYYLCITSLIIITPTPYVRAGTNSTTTGLQGRSAFVYLRVSSLNPENYHGRIRVFRSAIVICMPMRNILCECLSEGLITIRCDVYSP